MIVVGSIRAGGSSGPGHRDIVSGKVAVNAFLCKVKTGMNRRFPWVRAVTVFGLTFVLAAAAGALLLTVRGQQREVGHWLADTFLPGLHHPGALSHAQLVSGEVGGDGFAMHGHEASEGPMLVADAGPHLTVQNRARACPLGAPVKLYDLVAIQVEMVLNRWGDRDPEAFMFALRSRVPRHPRPGGAGGERARPLRAEPGARRRPDPAADPSRQRRRLRAGRVHQRPGAAGQFPHPRCRSDPARQRRARPVDQSRGGGAAGRDGRLRVVPGPGLLPREHPLPPRPRARGAVAGQPWPVRGAGGGARRLGVLRPAQRASRCAGWGPAANSAA